MQNKILIIRFSSIGDIVLTSPVIRCIKKQSPQTEIHFITKDKFRETLNNNPYITKLHTFSKDLSEVLPQLKMEKFDLLIDLHHNIRSLKLKLALGVKAASFNKLNIPKLLAVRFKSKGSLPAIHIVDRYFNTIRHLGIVNDSKGLDYFIGREDELKIEQQFPELKDKGFIALVAGGSYFTKRIPLNKLIEICSLTQKQFILLGDKNDAIIASQLQKQCNNVINACGSLSLNQSAYVISKSEAVVTSDTGLMHIAAAFKKKIFSLWGNTIPEFGMYPYMPGEGSQILEVKELSCRPCSKLGFSKCPKGHFKCMNQIDVSKISL